VHASERNRRNNTWLLHFLPVPCARKHFPAVVSKVAAHAKLAAGFLILPLNNTIFKNALRLNLHMLDVWGIVEILGASAASIGMITAARSAIMLLFPEKKLKAGRMRQKQALLVDSANNHEWTDVIGIGLLIGGVLLPAGIKATTRLTVSFVDIAVIGFAILAPFGVLYQGANSIFEAYKSRKLGKALEGQGFEVSITHKASVDWAGLLGALKDGAGCATISLIRAHSHGSMISINSPDFETPRKKWMRSADHNANFCPEEACREKSSVLGNGNIPDSALISMLSEVPGKKILVVNACQAGGNVDAARMLSGEKKDDVSVMTCTGTGLGVRTSPQARAFYRYIKRDSGNVPVSEFFEMHCKKHSGWRRFVRPSYRPVQFSGKNMRITL